MVSGAQLEPGEAVPVNRSVNAAAGRGHAIVRQEVPSSHMIATNSLRKAMREIAAKKGDFNSLCALYAFRCAWYVGSRRVGSLA